MDVDDFIAQQMLARGFVRELGHWVHPILKIKFRHRQIRFWIKHLESEKWPKKIEDEVGNVIKRLEKAS